MRVVLPGKREAGVGLHPNAAGWRLELSVPTESGTAELVDVSSGTKWVVDLTNGAFTLDNERFLPAHAYRVSIKTKGSTAESLIYLYPPRYTKQQLVFESDSDDATAAPLASVPKGAL